MRGRFFTSHFIASDSVISRWKSGASKLALSSRILKKRLNLVMVILALNGRSYLADMITVIAVEASRIDVHSIWYLKLGWAIQTFYDWPLPSSIKMFFYVVLKVFFRILQWRNRRYHANLASFNTCHKQGCSRSRQSSPFQKYGMAKLNIFETPHSLGNSSAGRTDRLEDVC